MKYDFRTRRYQVPDVGSWRWVEYCDCVDMCGDGEWRKGKKRKGKGRKKSAHSIPMRYWDCKGEVYPADVWHDAVYGCGGCF